jgi:rhodanese-related sulfurtransferase
MKKLDLILIGILFVASIWLLLAPTSGNHKMLTSKEMLQEIQKKNHFVSVDNLAKRIIENDPSILLIDVRNAKDFKTFALKNAVNIPIDSLLVESSMEIYEQENMSIIFYSNGTTQASEAWMMVRQMGFSNVSVLQGGVNEWFSEILNPEEPSITSSKTEIENYKFKVSAKQYFSGVKVDNQQNSGSSTTIKGNTSKKKKKGASGGCS